MGSAQSSCQGDKSESAGSVSRLGQGFGSAVTSTLDHLQGEVFRQTRSYKEIAGIGYDQFLDDINELNEISSHFLDANGKQLVFAVKKGTDATALWKATVKVACVKIDANTKEVDSYKLLTLKQFLQVFRGIQTQAAAIKTSDDDENRPSSADSSDTASDASSPVEGASGAKKHPLQLAQFSASMILNDLAMDGTSLEECCVCLERKPDVILPCAHSYCLPCIEQWNVNHKTCPVCREAVESTEDGWVISDGPDSLDIATQIQKSLMELAHE